MLLPLGVMVCVMFGVMVCVDVTSVDVDVTTLVAASVSIT